MSKFIDLTGQKFGKLTVLNFVEFNKKGNGGAIFRCICDCGNYKNVAGGNLKNKNVQSCGCYAIEKSIERNRKFNKYKFVKDYAIGYTSKKEEFYFDKSDYDLIKNYCWSLHKTGYPVAWNLNKRKGHLRLHRLVMNIKEDQRIDHISRQRNDCRKSNLRIATSLENVRNSSIKKNNTSGIIGVSFNKPAKRWIVNINIEKNIKTYLGLYEDFEEAIKARLKAELKYFGKDFAPQRHLFKQYGIE